MDRLNTFTHNLNHKEFKDISNYKTLTSNDTPITRLGLKNSFVNENPYERSSRRSTSRDSNQVKGITRYQHNNDTTNFGETTTFEYVQPTARTSARQYTDTRKFFNPDTIFTRTLDFCTLSTPTQDKSAYSRSMKTSTMNMSQDMQGVRNHLQNDNGNTYRGVEKEKSREKFNFRDSLGSLSNQIKNTLRGTISNNCSDNGSAVGESVLGEKKNKNGFESGETEEGYTRYEKTSSFFINSQTSRVKRPKFLELKKMDLSEQKQNNQNSFYIEKPAATSRFNVNKLNYEKEKHQLGRSSVTSSISANEKILKYSSVVEPMTPQLRTTRKYDSYNYEKQRKKIETSSFKNENPSNSSSVKTPSNFGTKKSSFLQRSSVNESSQLPKQRESQSSKQRNSLSGELSLSDFHLGSVKGEGRFGKFYPAIHKKSGMLVGIKQIKKQSLKNMLQQFIQQLKIQSFIEHPNIVKLYGYFATKDNFYLILQYMQEGSLFSFVKRSKKLQQQQASTKLKQICTAVQYLHQNQIIHRDIKPQNIVMTCDVCKLCDFGWAVYTSTRRKTYCGTLDYVCPEILQGDSYDSCVDIWAIGVLAFEMIVGKAPFYNISRKETMKKIMECNFQLPKELSQHAKKFISIALSKNPDQRQSMSVLVNHQFLC